MLRNMKLKIYIVNQKVKKTLRNSKKYYLFCNKLKLCKINFKRQ